MTNWLFCILICVSDFIILMYSSLDYVSREKSESLLYSSANLYTSYDFWKPIGRGL